MHKLTKSHQTGLLEGVNYFSCKPYFNKALKTSSWIILFPDVPPHLVELIAGSFGVPGLLCTSFCVWLLTACSWLFPSPFGRLGRTIGTSKPSLWTRCLVWRPEHFIMHSTSVAEQADMYSCLCFFFFFGHPACGILVPWSGVAHVTLQWKHGILTTGQPGKSLVFTFLIVRVTCLCPFFFFPLIGKNFCKCYR